ncbi:MAG TPA: hypothetical protein VK395_00905 [Gemmataceae bacterium]|nr:hypothetical protein [Gemmataceae bacterium]
MLFASWLQRLTTGSPTRSRRPRPRPTLARRSLLPRLEALEDRSLLSTFPVTNLHDSGAGSLRAGILSGDNTIDFAPGLHGTITLSSELSISKSVTINGPGANRLSVSGHDASRVFEIAAGNVAINGLTITDGQEAAANGGGILIDAGAALNLDQVVVADNSAYADSSGNYGNGGGIENDGSLSVADSTFWNNVASGGQYAASVTGPITEGSAGGAIDSQGPSLTVTNSAFTNNEAVGPATGTGEGNGGAINSSSPATITNSTFTGNEALGRLTNGGAISTGENETFAAPALAITNSTFTGNEAVGANGTNNSAALFGGEALGGAVANAGPLTITGSAFTDNLAKGGDQGNNVGGLDPNPVLGEVYGGGLVNFASPLTISDTIFSGNQAIGGNSATGPGAPAAGGGLAAEIFALTTLTDVTFVGNQARGGSGGTSAPGYPGTGGSGFGGGFYNGVDSTAVVSNTFFAGNQAVGGAGGLGAAGGVGAGGALANGGGAGAFELIFLGFGADTSSVSLTGSTLIFNVAQGGAGGSGSNGGNGLGGGVYVLGGTTASIASTGIFVNAALGGSRGTGGASGQGVGGGLYIDTGASVTLSKSTDVFFDFASTGADDIFGVYTIS